MNQRLAVLLGHTVDELHGTSVLDITHPADRDLATQTLGGQLKGEAAQVVARLLGKDGRIVWVNMVITPVLDDAGSYGGSLAMVTDITERRLAQERVQTLSLAVEQSPVSVVITDPSGAIEYVNPKFCEVTGFTAAEALGQNPRILQSGLTPPDTHAQLWRTVVGGHVWRGTLANRKKNGELYWEQASISPLYNEQGTLTHIVAVKEDVTERRRTEAALARANRALTAITAANEALVRASTEQELLAQVCQAIAEAGQYPLAWVGYKREDAEWSVQPMAWAGPAAAYVQQITISWADVPWGRGPGGRAIRTGTTQTTQNLLEDPAHAPWVQAAQGQGFASSIAIPLRVAAEVIGMLSMYAPEADAFDQEEQRLLEQLAEDLAYGIASQRVRVEREQVARDLRTAAAENALLAAAVENTTVGVAVTDTSRQDNPTVYVNQAYLRIFGYEEHEVLGRNPRFLYGDGTSVAQLQALHTAVAAGRAYEGTLLNYRKDGTPIWNEVRITPLPDAQGTVRNWVTLFTDVTEQVHMQAELEHLALHDQLTGLPNRSLLLDRTAQAILQGARQHTHAALLLLDLDHFKEVNDTFGHAAGDVLLQRVAQLLSGCLRATDTVARLGGDEFAALLPNTDARGAVETAVTVQRVLSEPILLEEHTVRAAASIGIALYPEHGHDAAALLQHADVAMYQAKRARHSARLYEPAQDLHTPDRATLTEEVRGAIGLGQLRLHYQPLVDLSSGQVTAVEALVRWQHPERGLLAPDTFIPLLEGLGLLGELTRWVLEEGLRQQRGWQAGGLDLAMNVNLAASDLYDDDLLAVLVAMLTGAERPARLCLELTEGALLADLAHTRAALLRLAAAGVQIAIDDYGTGHSSLSRLARLPVDQLKIDRLFVQALLVNPVDAAIVASTIGLAHSIGVPVVAEGVEDEATVTQLRELGCDLVQGYFYTRPLPPAAFERWLAAHTNGESG